MAAEGDRKPLPPGLYDLPITRALASNLAAMEPELQSIGELDPLEEELVDVPALLLGHGLEGEVVEAEQVDGG